MSVLITNWTIPSSFRNQLKYMFLIFRISLRNELSYTFHQESGSEITSNNTTLYVKININNYCFKKNTTRTLCLGVPILKIITWNALFESKRTCFHGLRHFLLQKIWWKSADSNKLIVTDKIADSGIDPILMMILTVNNVTEPGRGAIDNNFGLAIKMASDGSKTPSDSET